MRAPDLTINELDMTRLEALLERPEYSPLPAAAALAAELDRAEIRTPGDMPSDVVTMNSRVRFCDLNNGDVHVRTLVYPDRTDQPEDSLSVLAPLGAALLGLRIGSEISWMLPRGGETSIRVDAVIYQPEAAGDYHR